MNFAGLEGSKYHALSQKQFKGGLPCGVLTFGLMGGRERSVKFMDALKMIEIVTHVADARSCVLHPASHTHRQMTDEQLLAAGIPPELVRFSCGLEDASDIIADLEQAFETSK